MQTFTVHNVKIVRLQVTIVSKFKFRCEPNLGCVKYVSADLCVFAVKSVRDDFAATSRNSGKNLC